MRVIRNIVVALALSCCLSAQAPRTATPDVNAWRTETVKILSGLVQIDTTNPPGNETRAAQYLQEILKREGIEAEIFESAPGRGNLVARLKGNGTKKPLLLMGHIDVVGVERDKWSVDPFAAMIKEGYLYGRGASDDKAMVAANLEVFLQLKRLGTRLDRDVIFLAEAGEEGTSQFGIDFLVEKHWDRIAAEYALNEGGTAIIQNGKLPYVAVETTEKIPRGLNLVAKGTSGHGSMPRLDNAVTHLAAAVAKVGSWQPPMRLNATTKAFFARLATISPPDQAELYTHLDDPRVQDTLRRTNILFNSMLRTSVVPTVIKAGFRENVIPGDAMAELDVRALPDEDMDALVKTLEQLIDDPSVKIERRLEGQSRPAAPASGIDTEMFRALERAQKKVFPDSITVAFMQTGATDGAQLRAKGVQTYGIGVPFTEEELKHVHGNDERIAVDALGQFMQYLYAAVVEVAASR